LGRKLNFNHATSLVFVPFLFDLLGRDFREDYYSIIASEDRAKELYVYQWELMSRIISLLFNILSLSRSRVDCRVSGGQKLVEGRFGHQQKQELVA